MSQEIQRVKEVYNQHFTDPPVIVTSPGRVNLIGEHTDYNDGFVMPAAIDKVIVLAMSKNDSNKIEAYSVDMDEKYSADLSRDLEEPDLHWAKFFKGIVSELSERGISTGGFNVVFGGNIPIGSGLSSSAALEGGILLGLSELFDFELSRIEMARVGQLTEHNHVGVRCGIMDQFANLYGESGVALKLDCRSLEFERIPFNRDDIQIVLCNSKVSHNLASSEYNVRREQCEAGVAVLKKYYPDISNLRDVSIDMLRAHEQELDELIYMRCKFVIEENERVLRAGEYLENDDFEEFGQQVYASHYGLSNEYEVSCEELDILVELAKGQPGVLGARMMGGGFGGCTINFVEQTAVKAFTDHITTAYKEKTGIDTEIYITRISEGTHLN